MLPKLHGVDCVGRWASLVEWGGDCLHVASLARFGKPIDYGAKRLWGPLIVVASLVGWGGDCLYVASLPRFGKPSDYEASLVGWGEDCLFVASLARFGKPSDYGAERLWGRATFGDCGDVCRCGFVG